MKVWITNYWESRGIFEDEGGEEVGEKSSPVRYYSRRSPDDLINYFLRLGTDAHENPEAAHAHVRKLAKARVLSLRKRAAAIEAKWL